MGIFGGAAPTRRPQRRGPRSAPAKRPQPQRPQPVEESPDATLRRVLATNGAGLPSGPIDPRWRLIGDLGLDELDTVKVIMALEDAGWQVPKDSSDEALSTIRIADLHPPQGELVASRAPEPAPVAASRMRHVLRCPRCRTACELPLRKNEARIAACPSCQHRFVDLGPMPTPMNDVPVGGMLSALAIPAIPEVAAQDLITWACQWCGGNIGLAATICRRCEISLDLLPAFNVRDRVAGQPSTVADLFHHQAVYPLTEDVVLSRLGRLDARRTREIGGAESLVARQRPIPKPTRLP